MPSLYEAILGIVGFALVVRFAIVVAFPVIGPGDFDATRQTGFEIRVGLYEVEQLHQAFFIIDRATDRHVRKAEVRGWIAKNRTRLSLIRMVRRN
ncbi:hypothetical protein NKI32_08490 [Mesorhizobium sp. M0761]|uniref:hypothetical protein n=1 Tax=unclassified Mesorhizobium TaxID=325217 RepID=UPI003337BCC3